MMEKYRVQIWQIFSTAILLYSILKFFSNGDTKWLFKQKNLDYFADTFCHILKRLIAIAPCCNRFAV